MDTGYLKDNHLTVVVDLAAVAGHRDLVGWCTGGSWGVHHDHSKRVETAVAVVVVERKEAEQSFVGADQDILEVAGMTVADLAVVVTWGDEQGVVVEA